MSSWTKEETTQFQIDNNKILEEVNSTLTPPRPGRGKIGIFCPGQVGDLLTASSVLKYKDEIWPDKDIIWFVNMPNCNLLKYGLVNEVRPWPWTGNGLPEGHPDFYPFLCNENNRLNKELAKNYELTADLEEGYFPTPYMMSPEKRHGLDYPNISRKVFGIDPSREWHPVINFSAYEISKILTTSFKLLPERKTIMLETFCGSGQSKYWDDDLTRRIIAKCRAFWGPCNFIFASHPDNSRFFDDAGMISASDLTVRETALLINYCDLFVCMSSGISVATSYWGSRQVPKLQFCGSFTCSTVSLATGPIELVITDDITEGPAPKEDMMRLAQERFMIKLEETLYKYK